MVKQRFGLFDAANYAFLLLLTAGFVFPFLYVFNLSISSSFLIANGTFKFLPVGINLDAYKVILQSRSIWTGYANSVLQSVVGTLLTLILCSLPAYVLTAREFRHKKAYTIFFVATMFFNGGIIPTFLVIQKLGMLDTIWAIVIIPALSAWNIILFRTNFKEIPDSIIESAKIDGANHFWIYLKLVVALSKPIFAVLAIFSFVAIWNSYFPALLYLTSQDKQPLMIVLRKLVVVGNVRGDTEWIITQLGQTINPLGLQRSMKMATIMVSVLPIVLIYPFMQKYLSKGILVGSIKG